MNLSVASRPSFVSWLTLDRLVTAIVFISIFTMAVRTLADTDVWWHLQSGRWIVEQGAVPRADPFSHTRFGQPWINHGWLAQIVLFLLFDAFQYAGPALFVAAMVTLAFYFVWLQCPTGDRWLCAFVLIIAAAASGGIWAARPQIVSFALTAVVAYLLFSYKKGNGRAIWYLPLIMLLWVNIHGGFAIGFIFMVAYLFGEIGNRILFAGDEALAWPQIGRLALVMALCFLIVPLNPNGVQMWAYPFQTVGIELLKNFIMEWRPPNFHEIHFHPFIWLLLATLTALGLSGRRADFTDLTLVALFTYMSLLAARNVALFALVAAPVIIRYGSLALAEWRERMALAGIVGRPDTRPSPAMETRPFFAMVNWLILALLLLAALLRISQPISVAANEATQAQELPVGAVAFLRETAPDGPLFNSYNWGGYIIWTLPQYPVFIDGRTDLYGDALLREYVTALFSEEGWQEILDKYGVNLALIEAHAPLARHLSAAPDWREVYRDDEAVVFVRE